MFITLQVGRSTREWTKWRRNGVATNHWVFLRCDWSPISSWFYYQSQPYSKDEEKWYNHDIPNTNGEIVIGLNHMLAYVPFLLVPGRFCPSSKCPYSVCVHAKAKTRNQQTSNGRKKCRKQMRRHKADKHDKHGKQRSQKASKQAKGNKQESKQKVVSTKDKCRW